MAELGRVQDHGGIVHKGNMGESEGLTDEVQKKLEVRDKKEA
jgi:hypothetical protein